MRRRAGRAPEPSAAIIDSQTVKSTRTTGTRGYDAGGKILGRKRHIVVDTMGPVLAVLVRPANIQDRDGVRLLIRRAKRAKRWPRLQVRFADRGYAGQLLGWV